MSDEDTLFEVMNMLMALFLFGAGLLAGVLNSLAGGGSFIAFPALLLAGVPSVVANATTTFSALPGYVSGAIGYWKHIQTRPLQLLSFIAATIVGGIVGAEILLRVSDEQFNLTLPWLMGLAVFLFAFGARINAFIAARASATPNMGMVGAVVLFVLLVLVNIYGGFFNGGLGIILLAYLALAGMTNIHAMNGLKLLISSVVALIATIRFALGDSIAWTEGLYVFVGSLVGGFAAAKLAPFIPTKALRTAIIIYGCALTALFFWRAYFAI